jgi:putative transposase
VEDGLAARTMAAYIDLNPVRAGIVAEPAEYRWSSYGEAMGATGRSGAKAKAGLVRAWMAHKGWEADARHWSGRVSREYRMMLLEEGREKTRETVNVKGERVTQVMRKGMRVKGREKEGTGCSFDGLEQDVPGTEEQDVPATGEVALSQMLRWKLRYFTDGAVIGSRAFVDDLFNRCRNRFGPKRKSGARKLRGNAARAGGLLWSARDLRKGVGGDDG